MYYGFYPPHFNKIKHVVALLLLFSSFIFATPVANLKGSLSVEQGALNYTVALDLPKGVAGVAPKLSLNYSSNAGNGYLGQGWSIGGLSSISRCGSSLTTDGRNRPVRFDNKDNFCMDGQRLISVGENEYRTQTESYSKIVRSGDKGNPRSFKVWMKSGDVYEYGLGLKGSTDGIEGENTRTVYPTCKMNSPYCPKPYKVNLTNVKWMLSKISDRYGNEISFNYDKEKNNTPKISSISYANNKVEFVYDSREDIFSGYRKGESLLINKKLKSINIKIDNQDYKNYTLTYNSQSNTFDKLKLKSIKECIGGECTKPLTFEWQENSKRVSFEEERSFPSVDVKEGETKLADLNGDGFTDIYVVKGTSTNDMVYLNDGTGGYSSHSVAIKASMNEVKFVDIDGDGDVDIYEVDGGADNIWLNDGAGNFSESSSHPDIRANYDNILFVDIDQDKDMDIYVLGKSDEIWINNGKGVFYQKETITNPKYTIPGYIPQILKPYNKTIDDISFTDINDDGFLDIVGTLTYNNYDMCINSGGIYIGSFIYINDGNEHFTSTVTVSPKPNSIWYSNGDNYSYLNIDLNGDGITDRLTLTNKYIYDTITPPSKLYLSNGKGGWNSPLELPIYSKKEELKFIDINGDGNIDIYQVKSGTDDIWLNDGTGDFHKSSHHPAIDANEKNIKFADLNADGFVDIYEVKDGSDNIWLNNGTGSFSKSSEHPNVDVKTEFLALADLNGDGLTDIVPLKNGASIYTSQMKRPVITAFTDSFSNKTDIEYKLLTVKDDNKDEKLYEKDTDVKKDVFNIQNASLIVSKITTEKDKDAEAKQSYSYKGLKYNNLYGSLGFREITTKDSYGGEIVTNYYQEFPLVGNVKSTKVLLNSKTISESFSSLSATPKGKQYVIETTATTEKSYDDGALLSTITTNYNSYDKYGNVLKMTTTTSGDGESFTKTTTNQYDNSEQNWMLGRLKESSVKHEGWGDTITRKSSFTYNSKGSLESETIEQGDQALTSTKTYVYDKFGNRKKVTISAPSVSKDRVTEYFFDASGKNLLRTKNALGHTQKANNEYNKLGQLTKSTDANGQWVKIDYDKWGKKKLESRSDGTSTRYSYAYSNENGAKYKVTVTPTGSSATTTYYDKFDRVVLVKTKRFDGEEILVETEYNKKGEVTQKSLPHTESETAQYIVYSYDKQGRPVETVKTSPKGGNATVSESITYDGLSVTVTSPGANNAEHTKTTTKNALGQVVKVEQEEGTYVEYTYDAIGNLKTTTPNGNEAYTIHMEYDKLGHKKSMKDPDMGYWTYTYDALGQLKSQTDAKKQVTTIEYDQLGRKISETNADGTSTWVYDTAAYGKGKLAKESTNGISKSYSYDSKGRVKDVKTTISNKNFTQSYTYNADGKLATTTQPNGFKLINSYNEQGYLESIKSPVGQIKDFDHEHFAQLLEKTMSDGLEYYKKSLELSDKAAELRAKAANYERIAKRYKSYSKRYHGYATRLRGYAKKYEMYGKRYAGYSRHYRNVASYYQNKANYYSHRWWGRWFGRWYQRIANKYTYYANAYAKVSKYYLDKSKRYNYYAKIYDSYGNALNNAGDYYLKKAKELYVEADSLDKQAKELKRKSDQMGGKGDEQVSDAYQEILSDSQYVYHYKVLEQTSLGQVTKYLSGNGLVTEDEYNSAGTMTASKTGYTFDGGVRDLSYEYYDNYSLSKRTDSKLGIVQEYGYDALDRIETVTFNGENHSFSSHNYEYDVYGNLQIKDGNDLKYENGNHQVISIDNGTSIKYDKNGNMISKDRKVIYQCKMGGNCPSSINESTQIEYNAINKPTKITTSKTKQKNSITFTYDMNGNRYQKSEKFTDTYYIGKGYEYTEDGNKNKTHKYLIYANGKVVTVHAETTQIDYQTGEQLTTHNTQYLHYDSLGSVDTITNQQGSVVERMAYKPFGEQIDLTKLGKSITNRGYTGHEHIKGTDFIHMNARLYDPTIGRFLSADTVIQAPYDSQSYNRYSYVRNNPLKYTDPTGHFFSGLRHWVSRHWSEAREYIKYGLVLGNKWVQNYVATHRWAQTVGSIVSGMAGGPLGVAWWSAYSADVQGGSFSQVVGAGLTAYVSAGLANGIGDAYGHNSSFLNIGGETTIAGQATQITTSMAVKKAILHGIVRGMVHAGQGGHFESGFASGFVSSGISVGNKGFGKGATGVMVRTAIMAGVGGTTSWLTGGKFANGAESGAFVHMFNAEGLITLRKFVESLSTDTSNVIISSGAQKGLKSTKIDPRGANIFGDMIGTGVTGAAGGALIAGLPGAFIGGVFGTAGGFLMGSGLEFSGFNNLQETSTNQILHHDYVETFEDIMTHLTRY